MAKAFPALSILPLAVRLAGQWPVVDAKSPHEVSEDDPQKFYQKESRALEKLETDLLGTPPENAEAGLEQLKKVEALAQQYLQLGAQEEGDASQRLAERTYELLEKVASNSNFPEIKKRAPLYAAYHQLAQGDFDGAKEAFTELRADFDEAWDIVKRMKSDEIRGRNLKALYAWEVFIEEGQEKALDEAHGIGGVASGMITKLADDKTSDDLVYEKVGIEKDLIAAVRQQLLSGKEKTIDDALLNIDDPRLKPRAHDLLEQRRAGRDDGGNVIAHMIRYVSDSKLDAGNGENLLRDADQCEARFGVKTAYAMYSLLRETAPSEHLKNTSMEKMAALEKGKGVGARLWDMIRTTSLEEVAFEILVMKGCQTLGALAKLATLTKLSEAGITGYKATALAFGAEALAEGGAFGTMQLAQEAANHDAGKVLTTEHILKVYASNLIMIGGLKQFGNLSAKYAPRAARALEMVKAGGEELSKGGEVLVGSMNHAAGFGGMVATNQLNQKLGLSETPEGGFLESLAHDAFSYLKYGIAQKGMDGVMGPELAKKSQDLHQKILEWNTALVIEANLKSLGYEAPQRTAEGTPLFKDAKTQKLYVQLIRESLTKPGFDAGKLSGLLRDRKVGEAGDYLKGFGLDFERLGLDSEQREGIRASASRSQTRRTLGLLESPWLAPFWTMMGVGLGGGGLKEGRPGEVLLPETFRRKAEDLFEKVLAENSSLFLDRKYEPLIFRVKLGDEKAWQLLGELSRDPDSTVRGNVAASLGKIAGPEALAMLLEMREDPNMDVRMMVARAIGKIGASRALEPLREMRGDTANCVRSNVARAIGEIGGPEALAMLREMRGDAAELVRASVAEALAIRPGREALEMLCEMKGDPAPEVRRTIAQLLGNLGGPEALAILREMRGDPALFVCQAVDRALAKIGLSEAWGIPFDRMSDPEGEVLIDGVPYAKARALELVREVRRSPHGDVRMQVASALGQIGGSEALEMLGKMKGDPFELVRKSVAIALSEIGGERALEILASMDVHSIPLWALHQLLDSSTARYSSEPTVSPSPEARLTQEIRLRVARQVRREEINVARHGFHNGGNHRSLRQSPRGMDLASLREIKVGDPILGRLREINGVLLGEEHHFPQQGKVVLAIDPSLLAGENRENVAAVAGTLSEVSLLQRDSIALLIGTGQTRSFLAPREAKTTQSVVGRVLGHGNLNSASPVRLLDDPLLRQNLPSGSIVYLLGNYFAEENIAGLQRIFDGRRALGITVVPIQVGGRVLDSRHQVNFEGRKYPVHPAYSEGRTLAKAESRRSEVEALLKRNGGFALRDFSTASTVDVVDDLLRQRQQAPGARDSHVKLEAQLLSEHEGIKIRSQPHPSDIFARMHQIVEQENFPELKRLVDEAKGKGWSVVMDWVDRMYALVARTSLEREGRYDLFRAENLSPEAEKQVSDSIRREDPLPPPEAWGYSDGALKVMLRAAREFLQKEGENGGSVFPQESSSIVLPLEPGEKISRESGGDEKSASESPESAAATQNMPKPQSSTEQLWQERWDRADAALRVEMSRMWEYCQHYLMYRGYFFAGVPLEELMLTKSSYERFKPTEARSPSDWIELIRSMGLVPDLGVLSRLGVMAIGP